MKNKIDFINSVRTIKSIAVSIQQYEFAGLIRDIEKEIISKNTIDFSHYYVRIKTVVFRFLKLEDNNFKLFHKEVNILKSIAREELISKILQKDNDNL